MTKFILDETVGENYQIIEEMYAFISSDEKGEGIVSAIAPNGMVMPLVGSDKSRVESLKHIAKKVAELSNKKIKLIKFTNRIDLEDIT